LWNFFATLIQRYRESPELGWGRFALIKHPAARVLLHSCSRAGSTVVLAHNFGAEPASVTAKVPPDEAQNGRFSGAVLRDLLGGADVPLDEHGGFELELGRYGYRWFRVQYPEDRYIP
jgi:hypothetical protein